MEKGNLKEIYLAGGCFWGTEHYFKQIDGVVDTEVGFSNGLTENPTYKEVCTDKTGFAETVHVTYDPAKVSLKFLLEMYFKAIDPTSINRQGHDTGTQYRTGVYYTDKDDEKIINEVFAEEQKHINGKIAVENQPEVILNKTVSNIAPIMIDEILENNRRFVAGKGYVKHITDGKPSGKTLIVTCMDTRLSVMLPEALGIKNGEVKMVKVAGGVILDDYDAVMRSIIVGIYELGIEEIMLIHHTDCGAGKMTGAHMEHLIRKRITADKVAEVEQHIDLRKWLDGFRDTEKSIKATMRRVKNHPLVPDNIVVRGFIIDSTTGALTEIAE